MTDREPTITLVLDGDVPLELFVKAIGGFRELVDALSEEVGAEPVAWVVADLSIGSTSMTVRAETDRPEAAWQVVDAYEAVGGALARNAPVPYGERVVSSAKTITSVINGQVPSVRFETEDDIAVVAFSYEGLPVPAGAGAQRGAVGAYGSVEGTIETASKRRGLRFTLYDSLNDRAVSCYLASEREDLVRDAWGRRALVRGWLLRDAQTGRPLKISPVEEIEVLPEASSGGFRRARGVLAGLFADETPAEAVRRLRDA